MVEINGEYDENEIDFSGGEDWLCAFMAVFVIVMIIY